MEKFYVAKCYGTQVLPAIVEEFNNSADAQSYAALMNRTKGAAYIVLEMKEVIISSAENEKYKEWRQL